MTEVNFYTSQLWTRAPCGPKLSNLDNMSALSSTAAFTSSRRCLVAPHTVTPRLLLYVPKRRCGRLHAASPSEVTIPWSLFVAEQDKAAQRLLVEQDKAAQRLSTEQDKAAQRMMEIGELQAQKAQLLQDLVYARGEIDVRGALEIIARIEEARMPSSKQRRGVQQILAWLVQNDTKLKSRIKKTCSKRKLDDRQIRSILQNSLYATACQPLHGTSHTHLTVCEQHPWPPNQAAAVCIVLETFGLDYQYRNRSGDLIASPYS